MRGSVAGVSGISGGMNMSADGTRNAIGTSTTTTRKTPTPQAPPIRPLASRSASARPMLLFLWSPRTWQRVRFDATVYQTLEPPFPGSYLAAVTDFTEMVSPLAVPVTLASSQASLLRLSSAA